VVWATVNSLLQRVPPRAALAGAAFTLKRGADVALDDLFAYLEGNGFTRGGTVMEAGDYAVRGGIVDIFPPGAAEPVRLDLFGESLEAIKTFDPVSQRSSGALEALNLLPVSEVVLKPETIARFKSGYRGQFGAVTDSDPLFEAVGAGRRYPGMEHWLPLFHASLETIFDYLPEAVIFFDPLAEQACNDRWEAIDDYYRARTEGPGTSAEFTAEDYKPLPPEMLYLTHEERDGRVESHPLALLSPFTAEERPEQRSFDAGGRQGRAFTAERSQATGELFDAVEDHLKREIRAGRRVVLAGWSQGTRERIARLLTDHGVEAPAPVDDWLAAAGLPGDAVALAVLPMEHGFTSPDLTVIAEQDILGDRRNFSPMSPNSLRAISWSTPTTASAAMTGSSRSTSTPCSMIVCASFMTATTGCCCRWRISSCCRATARPIIRFLSTSSAAPRGRRAKRASSSGSRRWPTS
jgi:transcription-repair coupling factor (superfamily II helicase)